MDEYDICPRKNFIEKRCKILFNEIKFKSWLYHPPPISSPAVMVMRQKKGPIRVTYTTSHWCNLIFFSLPGIRRVPALPCPHKTKGDLKE